MKAETLKKSILQYAMQGKLVEQNPDDEPASELLKRIKAEKDQLIKDGKIKKEKPLPSIAEDEIPYELPQGWEWVRLGNICSKIVDGDHNPPTGYPVKTEYLMLSASNINYNKIVDLEKVRYLTEEIFIEENKRTNLQVDDILFTIVGTLGRSCIYDGKLNICFQRSVSVLTTLIYNKYLKIVLDSPYIQTFMQINATGTAQKGFYLNQVSNLLIPIPPLAEQQRIVEMLEQILPLIEEYDKNEEKLSELNKTLPDKIKQSILQHAVQGKLVPQNPTDEPASELLKRIKSEKEQLIKDGKIKKEKPLPPITEDEIPYELPQGWEWVRIGTITDIGTGTTPSTSNYEYYNGNINWISSSSTGNDYIMEPDKLISQKAVDECNLRIYNPDTLIIALYGQGKTRGQITQLKIQSCINQACAAICIINKNLLNLSYIKYFYKKQYNDIRSLAAGGAQPNLNVGKIKNTIIPLPPLSEQQRIVDKVEELISVVDRLTK